MLSTKDNELLCQTGKGTPMGTMLREYWWPVLRSDKLEPDGAPERVRLLGEDYVAFRATDGRLGFFDEYCPHRRVSLVLARNEECGLRCVMHGWKIDVSGKVVETPNEAEAGARLDRIKVRHFPIREAGKMIWVYVGEKTPPPFPDFPFNNAYRIEPLIAKVECNWIQVMETLWDPAHVGILHAQGNTFKKAWEGSAEAGRAAPRSSFAISGCETRDEPYGFKFRFGGEGSPGEVGMNWVPTVMPCWVLVGGNAPREDADQIIFAHTPVDDENMLLWEIPYNLTKEFGDFGRINATAVGEEYHNFRLPNMSRETNWGQNRHAMRYEGSWCGVGANKGIQGVFCHDIAVAESMGKITDRSFEHLGPADHAVIKGRQVFLQALRDYVDGKGALGLGADMSVFRPQRARIDA